MKSNMELTQFARDYLSLGLRINKHIEGYVEHYYGPSKIKTLVDSELKKSPKLLLDDCLSLINSLPDQGFKSQRKNFLFKTLKAIKTILNVLKGKNYQYLDLVEKLYDFKPVFYEDKFFYDLSAKADELYKGDGNLADRMISYSNKRNISGKDMKKKFIKALSIVKERTREIFPFLLPEEENITIIETKNKSWQLYCWYQGDFNSIVEINTDRIQFWTSLIYNVCHEGYPGHHTERCVREYLLHRKKNYFECSILLIYTPEMVISEGIGVKAEDVLYEPFESAEILFNELNPEIKEDIDTYIKQNEIRKGFRRFESNLAYHKFVHNWSDERLINYMKNLEIIGKRGIEGIMRFISDELWAPYIQTYQGERLITEKYGDRPNPDDFRKILASQTLPSVL